LWTGCVAGALVDSDYTDRLKRAGFENVNIEATHIFDATDITRMAGEGTQPDSRSLAEVVSPDALEGPR
jgi:hypothetical protein